MGKKLEIAVKVNGTDSSKLKFNNVIAHRIIEYTSGEFESLIEKVANLALIIIENAKIDDIQHIKEFEKKSGLQVYLFNPEFTDKDSNISSDYIYNSLNQLQEEISFSYGINVRTFIAKTIRESNLPKENIEESESSRVSKGLMEAINSSIQLDESKELNSKNDTNNTTISTRYSASKFRQKNKDKEIKDWNTSAEVNELLNESNTAEVSEDSHSISLQKQKLTNKISEMLEELNSYETREKNYKETIERFRKVQEVLEDKLAFTNNLINQLQTTSSKIIDVESKDSTESIEKIARLNADKLALESQVQILNREIKGLQGLRDKADKLEDENKILQEKLFDVDKEYSSRDNSIKESLEKERQDRIRLTSILEALGIKLFEIDKEYKELNIEFNNTKKVLSEVKSELYSSKLLNSDFEIELNKVKEVSNNNEKVYKITLSELDSKNRELAQLINKLRTEKRDIELEVVSLKSQLDVFKNREITYASNISQLENQISANESLIESKNTQISKLELDLVSSSVTKNENDNSDLLKKQIVELKKELLIKDNLNSSLTNENNSLKSTAKALSSNANAGENMKLDCKYTSSAKIIQVFGSGGSGTTTLAISLAKKLSGNILLMDFDCVNPKMDIFLGTDIDSKETALSLLLDNGTSFILDNIDTVIQSTSIGAGRLRKSNRKVDYFSGIYNRVESYKLASVDFTELFNCLGENYDYIILDMGRIGGSEVTNSLIKMINSIASSINIITCNNNVADTHYIMSKLKLERISQNKSKLVFNLCSSSAINADIKSEIANISYSIIVKEDSLFNTFKTYDASDSDLVNKSTIEQLVEELA